MMPIESPILRRDDSVLKFWRDPLEGYECGAFPIRAVLNHRLDAALHLHARSRRVDEAQSDKGKPPRQIQSGQDQKRQLDEPEQL